MNKKPCIEHLFKIFDHKVVSAVCNTSWRRKKKFVANKKEFSSDLFFHDRCVHP